MVVFLGVRTSSKDGQVKPVFSGTAFFVGHENWAYLVTARHVAEGFAGPFVLGHNDERGNLYIDDIDSADWHFHEDKNVDVAVMTARLTGADWAVFLSSAFASRGDTNNPRFGTGDLVYIVGLYRLFPVREKIVPIVHTGHIAMTPDEEIPIRNRVTGKRVNVCGYLVEAQTLEGLSGSPVFVRYSVPTGIHTALGQLSGYSTGAYLLGLWVGAWDAPPGETLAEQVGGNVRVPVGMGVTIPAERIIDVLNCDALRQQREKAKDEEATANAASMDSDSLPSKSEPPTTTDNPRYKEDFNSFVGVAARRKPRAD